MAHLTGWLKGLGFRKVVLRSDNEPGLLKLLDEVSLDFPGIELVSKTSPDGDNQALIV